MRVLFVEDEATFDWVEIVAEELAGYGLEIELADGPSAALAALRKNDAVFDAVLLDILMPTEGVYSDAETAEGTSTGVRLLRDIRAIAPSVPVALVSIKPARFHAEELQSGLVQEYVEKPADSAKLAKVIFEMLGRSLPVVRRPQAHAGP